MFDVRCILIEFSFNLQHTFKLSLFVVQFNFDLELQFSFISKGLVDLTQLINLYGLYAFRKNLYFHFFKFGNLGISENRLYLKVYMIYLVYFQPYFINSQFLYDSLS